MQEAAATGLEQANDRKFFEQQLQEYEERRDVLVSYFDKLGIKYTLPQGTYFVLVVSQRHDSNFLSDIPLSRIFPICKFPTTTFSQVA
jgi:aspartate/methionine/tyrosine aminotransferase